MTESLSNQFDGMLPGIDWSEYKENRPNDTILGRPRTDEEVARGNQIRRYREAFPNVRYNPWMGRRDDIDMYEYREAALSRAAVPLEGLHSARMFYTPEQEAEVSSSLEKVHRVAKKRSPTGLTVPENMRVSRSAVHDDLTGERKYTVALRHPAQPEEPWSWKSDEVGKVVWQGNSGHVNWLGVEPGYEHIVPHLVSLAHKLAADNGDTGPTHSTDLTSFSHKLMKRFLPSFIDRENTTVDGEDLPEEPHR